MTCINVVKINWCRHVHFFRFFASVHNIKRIKQTSWPTVLMINLVVDELCWTIALKTSLNYLWLEATQFQQMTKVQYLLRFPLKPVKLSPLKIEGLNCDRNPFIYSPSNLCISFHPSIHSSIHHPTVRSADYQKNIVFIFITPRDCMFDRITGMRYVTRMCEITGMGEIQY